MDSTPSEPQMTKGHAEAISALRPEYKELDEQRKGNIGQIKTLAIELYAIFADSEPSREMSLAKTKLEEAVMWAVKSLTK